MNIRELMIKESKKGETNNGSIMYSGTDDIFADLYLALCPGCTIETVRPIFRKAFTANPEKASALLLHYRDIREGKGRRDVFTDLIMEFYMSEPYNRIGNWIEEIGGLNDIIRILRRIELKDGETFWSNPIYREYFKSISLRFEQDYNDIIVNNMASYCGTSLVGKWLPTVKRNKKDREFLRDIVRSLRDAMSYYTKTEFHMNERKYRDIVKQFRYVLNLPETNMTNRTYHAINYKDVCSVARRKHRKAFERNDSERWKEYCGGLLNGSIKMKTDIINPSDICSGMDIRCDIDDVDFINGTWKNIMEKSDYDLNVLPILDTSASMDDPIEYVMNGMRVSSRTTVFSKAFPISLFLSLKNKNPIWNGLSYVFSSRAKIIEFDKSELFTEALEKVIVCDNFTTNLQAVFSHLLTVAKENNLSQEDLPEYLMLISDCQLNDIHVNGEYGYGNRLSQDYMSSVAKLFNEHGYTVPKLIVWYVGNPDNDSYKFPVYESKELLYVVGYNMDILKCIKDGKFPSVFDTVKMICESERWGIGFENI